MNIKELLIATKNPGKFSEIQQSLKDLPVKLLFLGDLDIADEDFVEDGESFKENAFKKARYYFEKSGLMTFGEDSGIIVEALKDELGVKTRRFGAGEMASDLRWVEYFLQRMDGVEDRRAEFFCCACLYSEGLEEYFYGETKGMITDKLMAPLKEGIPLSSCFLPEGMACVYAALSAQEKNGISHRGKAVRGVREWLMKNF